MNTCKAALKVLRAKKLYIIIYLVWLGLMMSFLSWSSFTSSDGERIAVYEPERPAVAVIDRDGDAAGLSTQLKRYLSASCDLEDIEDGAIALQQAVASNYVDALVVIPSGYADRLADALEQGIAQAAQGGSGDVEYPKVDTTVSYTSARGSIGSLQADGFFSLIRQHALALAAEDVAAAYGTGSAAQTGLSLRQLETLAVQAADTAQLDGAVPPIAVDYPDEASETAETEETASAATRTTLGFALKVSAYPIVMTAATCTAVLLVAFYRPETKRRLAVSPVAPSRIALQQWTVCGLFGIAVAAVMILLMVALSAITGHDLSVLGVAQIAGSFGAMAAFALVGVAFGFFLSTFSMSDSALNGIVNVVGLAMVMTSGAMFSADMMSEGVKALGRALGGWWFCEAINDALGIADAASVDWSGWLGAMVLMAMYAVAFVALGVAVNAIRERRALYAAPQATPDAS